MDRTLPPSVSMARCNSATSPGGAAACHSVAARPVDAPAGFLRRLPLPVLRGRLVFTSPMARMVGDSQKKGKTTCLVFVVPEYYTAGRTHHLGTRMKINWFTASCVLVSNIIGGGIFTTTGLMARDLGDPWLILLLWLI